jgi:hypothetical protein
VIAVFSVTTVEPSMPLAASASAAMRVRAEAPARTLACMPAAAACNGAAGTAAA